MQVAKWADVVFRAPDVLSTLVFEATFAQFLVILHIGKFFVVLGHEIKSNI